MLALLFALGLFVVEAVFLVVGADWFVDGARDLARDFGVSALVVRVLLADLEPEEMLTAAIASARGVPTLAIGNVIGVSAARKKQSDLLVGGILGSFAYNLLVTLGLAATIHALPVDPHVTFIALPVMIAVHLILLALV